MTRRIHPSPARWSPVPAVLVAAVLASACADGPPTVVEPDVGTVRGSSPQVAPPGLGVAFVAQARHGDGLMSIPGVVGHGVGLGADGEPTVVVFTDRPGVAGIPARVDGVRTRTSVTGMFTALTEETARHRPAPVGVSIGHPDITAGTLGFKVEDGAGNTYVLSNNHVLANGNDAVIGDNILQPGPYDGGTDPADAIGSLADFVEIDFSGGNNLVDAALASVASGDVLSHTPDDEGYGQPSATTKAAFPGMAVQKYGRTTGHTFGEVDAVNATTDVCYQARGPFRCVALARFVGQIIITPGAFSAGGDSGSGIVTDDGALNPVGLLFAGSSAHTIANPIDEALNAFGVTVDDGSGGGGPGNQPPVAVADSYTAAEGVTLVVAAPGVLANDTDGDGDPLTAVLDAGATGGALTLNADGSFTYTPDPGTTDDSFTYHAFDGSAASNVVTVTLTVNEPASSMHVGGLSSSSLNQGSTWDAVVTITVVDANGQPVQGADVSGAWVGPGSGSGDCLSPTDENGQCSVARTGIRKRDSSVTYTVQDVSHASLSYDEGANAQTTIVVDKP